MTRDEYMAASAERGEKAHRKYYAQYVTPAIISRVAGSIGVDRIMASKDPYFNDVPAQRFGETRLAQWDRLDPLIRPVGYAIYRNLHNTKTGQWSLSDTVCVAKEAARQIQEGA